MPTIHAPRGLPGAGKSTLAGRISSATGAVHVELDVIKRRVWSGVPRTYDPYSGPGLSVQEAFEREVALHLAAGRDVVADRTNLNPEGLRRLERLGARIVIHDLRGVPVADCIRRDDTRPLASRIGVDGNPGPPSPVAVNTYREERNERMSAAQFAAAYAALTASHEVADHWVQQDAHAVAKGDPGRTGAVACAKHVATYTATQALVLAAVNRVTGARLSWKRAAAALAVSAATHYVADRQGGHWRDLEPHGIVRLAAVTGHSKWLVRDPNAGYLMDQAWHKGWIAVAALVASGRGGAER